MTTELGTVAPVGFDDFPPEAWLSCLRRLGCTRVQVYRNQQRDVSLEEIRDAVAAGQMPCDSIHGVFGEQFDPSSPDEQARRFAVDTYKSEGELALTLGGPLVVVHCSTIRREGIPQAERKQRVEQLKKSIVELGNFGEGLGVRYAFENLPDYHPLGSDVAELAGWLGELNAPATGMCFDSGHANMIGNVAEAVEAADGRMIYMHFSDNSGLADEHEMPTCGTLDCEGMARALHLIGYADTMMLEVFHSVERFNQLIDEGCGERLARILALARGQK